MTYRFARFSVNSDTRQLLADGREVHLSPKAFELLLALIEQRARALSKAELQDRLWPSTFVGETNLATLVAEIRRALDDSAHGSACVRTVHRFGYRFVADVVEGATPCGESESGIRMYVTHGDREFLLMGGPVVMGRAHDAGIRIDSGGVSRHHARILITDHEARVEDLDSKNGTFVNGERVIGTRLLKDGDEIRLGPVVLAFKVTRTTQVTETVS
ncbi:MAG TPA: FHA domain-containing protein [Vicinamibacterales bacterium]|nr:FHA domain-containing protein [Vicinamibacterales bacterium]